MFAPESVSFTYCVFDVTALMSLFGAIFHLEISPMPALSFHSDLLLVSSPFFRSPDDIGEAENFPGDISSLE